MENGQPKPLDRAFVILHQFMEVFKVDNPSITMTILAFDENESRTNPKSEALLISTSTDPRTVEKILKDGLESVRVRRVLFRTPRG